MHVFILRSCGFPLRTWKWNAQERKLMSPMASRWRSERKAKLSLEETLFIKSFLNETKVVSLHVWPRIVLWSASTLTYCITTQKAAPCGPAFEPLRDRSHKDRGQVNSAHSMSLSVWESHTGVHARSEANKHRLIEHMWSYSKVMEGGRFHHNWLHWLSAISSYLALFHTHTHTPTLPGTHTLVPSPCSLPCIY